MELKNPSSAACHVKANTGETSVRWKRKVAFIQEAHHLGGWQTHVQRPSLKFLTKEKSFKGRKEEGEFQGTEREVCVSSVKNILFALQFWVSAAGSSCFENILLNFPCNLEVISCLTKKYHISNLWQHSWKQKGLIRKSKLTREQRPDYELNYLILAPKILGTLKSQGIWCRYLSLQ